MYRGEWISNMKNSPSKIVLDNTGARIDVPVKRLMIILNWNSEVDLDLMAFFKAKDGRVGGVFSNNYPKGFMGDLASFPYIKLDRDSGINSEKGYKEEILRIANLEDIEDLYIVALNYTDAVCGKVSHFVDYDGRVLFLSDNADSIEIPLNSETSGTVAVICRIAGKSDGGAVLINVNEIVDFPTFLHKIPGAELISEQRLAVKSGS